MGGQPKTEIDRLRTRAGRLGISIRTQKANGTSSRRAYSLIDRTTGTVLHRDVDGLIDIEAVLSRVVWERQRARADGPPLTDSGIDLPGVWDDEGRAVSLVQILWPRFRADGSRSRSLAAVPAHGT